MCVRFWIDEETIEIAENFIRHRGVPKGFPRNQIIFGDIRPTDFAPVISREDNKMTTKLMQWGFQGPQEKGLLINARSESVLEKPTFAQSVRQNRIAIPAGKFYEWDADKNKVVFSLKSDHILYLAGSSRIFDGIEHFVVYTTAANDSMVPVHDRMPLFFDEDKAAQWILDDRVTEHLLREPMPQLERWQEYRQQTLFDFEKKNQK